MQDYIEELLEMSELIDDFQDQDDFLDEFVEV